MTFPTTWTDPGGAPEDQLEILTLSLESAHRLLGVVQTTLRALTGRDEDTDVELSKALAILHFVSHMLSSELDRLAALAEHVREE